MEPRLSWQYDTLPLFDLWTAATEITQVLRPLNPLSICVAAAIPWSASGTHLAKFKRIVDVHHSLSPCLLNVLPQASGLGVLSANL